MMKGGKEEDKIMGPIFPRLHVNDTDKGGPRAPPRNKMALYEQLSIPLQRFNSSGASSLPLPPPKSNILLPSSSSSQGYGHERSVFSPFYVHPHRPTHSAEKVNSHSSGGLNLNNTRMELERRPRMHANNNSVSAAECSPILLSDSPNAKHSSGKKFEEDDFRVPTFVQSGSTAFSSKKSLNEPKKLTPFYTNNSRKGCSVTFNSSIQFPNSNQKSLEQRLNHSEEKLKDISVINDTTEVSEVHPESGEKFVEPSSFAKTSLDQDYTGEPRCLNGNDVVEEVDTSQSRNEAFPKASLRSSHGSPMAAQKSNQKINDKASGALAFADADRSDKVSEDSMESILGMDISPNDVVGVIGSKHFWKARRAIVNQQRVFAVQVFELHRLIKVQKLIAASPHELDANRLLTQTSLKLPTKTLPPQHIAKSHIQNDTSQKPNQKTKDLPPHSSDSSLNKGLTTHIPSIRPFSEKPLPVPAATPDNKQNPWCFHPPPNQWLVPVMSPSEGLVYKPYTSSCPSTPGFMAPIYGSCGPVGFPPLARDFVNPGVPPNYYPTPYEHPMVTPVHSASAVEQVSPFTGSRSNLLVAQHSRSSCNVSNPRSEATLGRVRKFQATKDSEVQGSTASSPCEKAQEGKDPLPLFPMASEGGARTSDSCGRDSQTRVIRVVPHNARSATASAARIFKSIQEERQQYES